MSGINEAAAGNVLICKIPDSRRDLKVKYSSKNFPMLAWKSGHSREHEHLGGLFLFPCMEPEGYMKIVIRQTKYTNPEVLEDGRFVSIPKTANSSPPFNYLTKNIVGQVEEWLNIFFPDLIDLKWESRILWYTDTINNYIYDFVPGRKNLFVACGGSGHAFKMLPVLGQFLVDKIEGREIFIQNFSRGESQKTFLLILMDFRKVWKVIECMPNRCCPSLRITISAGYQQQNFNTELLLSLWTEKISSCLLLYQRFVQVPVLLSCFVDL